MLKRRLNYSLILTLALVPGLAFAAPKNERPVKLVHQFANRTELSNHFRAMGYKALGGVDRDQVSRSNEDTKLFPHFTSSFSVGGVTYPFTMVGHPPKSGRTTEIRSVLVPLRMNFVGFGPNQDVNHTFEPGPAVVSMVHSPLYEEAHYANGTGQFGDQMQRAAFWNQMDEGHRWHVKMANPKVARTVDIEVTPAVGTLSVSGTYTTGDVPIDFMDSQIRTMLQFLDLDADELPIFVTGDVTAQALGYHTAFTGHAGDDGHTRLQTFMYSSWLDPAQVSPLFADVSTFNHELAEWLNDPFVNNATPDWRYPPESDPSAVCSGNASLEVGDPQGNGPTFADFPTLGVRLDGVTYHLQQLVLWQWFTDQVPSSAFGGWYSFPTPSLLTAPAVYCK